MTLPTDVLACGCPVSAHASRRAGAYELRRGLNVPRCALGRHSHPQARLVLTLGGNFQTSHGRRSLAVDEHSAVYRPAWDEHEDAYDGPVESLALLLPADTVPQEPFLLRDEALPGLTRAFRIEWDIRDSAANLVLEGLATLAASLMSHRRPVESRGKAHWITRVREQLEASYATTPTLAELAQSVDRDAAYVAASFRRIYGSSVGAYLRECRLWQARARLQRGDKSLALIAQECGYSDQSHFTRQFRRLFSITPSEYRRRHLPVLPAAS